MYQMQVMIRRQGDKKWETTYVSTDAEHVLKMFSENMVAKYIGKAPYVKSIKRKQNYNGTATYTVNYTLSEKQEQKIEYILPIYC